MPRPGATIATRSRRLGSTARVLGRRLHFEPLEDRRLLAMFNGVPLFDAAIPIEPYRNAAIGDGPVLLHSGELVYSQMDLAISGRGLDWSFQRTYRSGAMFEGPLGHGWDHPYNGRLVELNATNLSDVQETFPNAIVGDVARMDGTGRADLYENTPGDTYMPPAGFYTRLTKEIDGSFTERNRDGTLITYAAADADGLAPMTSITDRNGNVITLKYNAQGQLETVIDTFGREIEYFYNPDGYLSEVRDYANRSIKFAYDTAGNLTSVTSPAVTGTSTGNDFPDGRTEAYTYSSGFGDERLNHNLLSVTAPNEVAVGGPPRMAVTYEESSASPHADRVLSVALGGVNDSEVPAGGEFVYAYFNPPTNPDLFQTTVIDPNGNLAEYQTNQLGNIVSVVEQTNRNLRPGEGDYQTTFEYNADSQLLRSVLPEGNSVEYVYDDGNPDRFQQGNLLSVPRIADVDRSGDQMELTTTFTYEPIYNQIRTMVEPRGNDPSYVPQNGGPQSAERYMTRDTFDYQEGANFAALGAELGISALDAEQLLIAAGVPMNLGDVNGDGRTDQIAGNVIRTDYPTVNHLPGSNQAAIEGDLTQEIFETWQYNQFGQMVQYKDPEANVTDYHYYSEQDPDGDGIINNPAGDAVSGGYLQQIARDMSSDPIRNSGTDPAPTNIRTRYEYDPVGNVTRLIDGRGIATDYEYNELNETVQITRAAAVDLLMGDPDDPLVLALLPNKVRYDYDANGNLNRHQIEDRGNTSNVGILGDVDGDRDVDAADVDALYAAFGQDPTPELDLYIDGVVDVRDAEFLVHDILGAAVGDYNLNGTADAADYVLLRKAMGQTTTNMIADGNRDGVVNEEDHAAWRANFGNTKELNTPTAFVDYAYQYDILDQLVQESAEVDVDHRIVTRYRYDSNGNRVLTILPEGNATSAVLDERDLLLRSTAGAAVPPPLVLLAPGDPTDYDVRGGLPSTTTYHYDGNANLIETVDADDTDGSAGNNSTLGGAGDRTRYLYDGFDRPTSVIDAVGNQSVIQYDPAGNVVRESHFGPVGGASPTADGVNPSPGPVSIAGVIQVASLANMDFNPLLASTEYQYDELSRPYQTDQVLFIRTTSTMRTPDVADGATDLGKGDLTPGDNQGIAATVPLGVDILGRVSTRTEFDRSSRPTFLVEDDKDTYRTDYDGAHRVLMTTDPEGNTVEFAYDDNGNPIETRETDVAQVAGVADEVFLTTHFYDSLNRLQQTVDNLGHSTEYRYDSRDNLVAVADAQGPLTGATITRRAFAGGALTVNTINDFGNVMVYYYDGLSRRVRTETVLTESGEGDGVHIGASIFGIKKDPAAPESFLPAPDPAQGGGDGLIRSGVVYDQNSLVSAELDDQGNVTVYLFDNLNRRVAQTNGMTTATAAPWDKNLILGPREIVTPTAATISESLPIIVVKIDYQLNVIQGEITAIEPLFPALADQIDDHPPTAIVYGWDPDGNLLILEDENDTEVFTSYDAVNRPIAVRVFRAGQSDSHAGDPVFAPAPVSDPSNPSTTFPPVIGTTKQDFRYDGLSRVTASSDNIDPTVFSDSFVGRSYDSLSRVIEERQNQPSVPLQVVSHAWRAENLQSNLVYPNGREVQYTYDGLDRMMTVRDQGTGSTPPIASTTYIGASRVLQMAYGNVTRMTYLNDAGTEVVGYDGLRRPTELRHLRKDNSLLVGFQYTYDRRNNQLAENKLHAPGESELRQYDSADRLVQFERGALDPLLETIVTPSVHVPLHSEWDLDGNGNWDHVDDEDRQHSSNDEITLRAEGGPPVTLQHDDNGNLTDDGTNEYRYDFLNRLRQVIRKSDSQIIAIYTYDVLGRRIRKVVSNSGPLNGTTRYYYDGPKVIEELATSGSSTLMQQYVFESAWPSKPIVADRDLDADGTATGSGDQRLFYHTDARGSTHGLSNDLATLTLVEGYLYDAHGRQWVVTPGPDKIVSFGGDDIFTAGGASAVDNPYQFAGRRLDPETGLHLVGSRYFDTELGRFITRSGGGGYQDEQHKDWIEVISVGPSPGTTFDEVLIHLCTAEGATQRGHIEIDSFSWGLPPAPTGYVRLSGGDVIAWSNGNDVGPLPHGITFVQDGNFRTVNGSDLFSQTVLTPYSFDGLIQQEMTIPDLVELGQIYGSELFSQTVLTPYSTSTYFEIKMQDISVSGYSPSGRHNSIRQLGIALLAGAAPGTRTDTFTYTVSDGAFDPHYCYPGAYANRFDGIIPLGTGHQYVTHEMGHNFGGAINGSGLFSQSVLTPYSAHGAQYQDSWRENN